MEISDQHIIENNFIIPAYIPDRDLGDLFMAVQTANIFTDSKTFVDCVPNKDPALILQAYQLEKDDKGFLLKDFVYANFALPTHVEVGKLDANKDMIMHLQTHWEYLTMASKSEEKFTSLISLPYPFVVPGGRFREMFYWDSYFTIIGLLESDKDALALGMIHNMAYLVTTYGHIPNGNRTYFLSRSQPPFFAEMIKCYAAKHGMEPVIEFLPALEQEYKYWTMNDKDVNADNIAMGKSVCVDDGIILHRYTGTLKTPRAEAYNKERAWAQALPEENRHAFYQNMRAACESGWDFSSRWFADGKTRATVQCEDQVPICLNSLLYNCELQIADMYLFNKDKITGEKYKNLAETRKVNILKHLWFEQDGVFNDYNFKTQTQNVVVSLAMVYPLFFGIANQAQADKVADILQEKFLVEGGVVTTLVNSGEQWDYPNGWAPLQWLTVIGLANYGHSKLAKTIAERWLNTNESLYQSEQKMTEKYNVVDPEFPGGGGNYENQDGFGWTNGVALALHAWLQQVEKG